ncbi:GNAT family protein [Shewanella vesiculosa]|jgi:RimJ/RimL family protein N-acetyltransferase|uniref:GNAT family protein n=1 Tax=Shewanella vesiculosa TaxID=518738 RepID=A0ABV0FM51_9GAMM
MDSNANVRPLKCPTLTSGSLIIRPLTLDDLIAFTAYRADPNVARYQSWTDYHYQDALSLLNLTNYQDFAKAGQWYQLAISDQHELLMGDLAVHFIDDTQVEVGFTVAPAFQGQGIAAQALTCLLQYLFVELSRHRVIAQTDCLNLASAALLEKLQFRREGHFINNVFFKGAWGDEYLYAMLASEFNTQYSEYKS